MPLSARRRVHDACISRTLRLPSLPQCFEHKSLSLPVGNCSPWCAGGLAARRVLDGCQHGCDACLGGADDGSERGAGLGSPSGAEPVRDLAEHHARPQRALGHVVGGRHIAVGDEHAQVLPAPPDPAAQLLAHTSLRHRVRHDAVEPALQVMAVLHQRGVAQPLASSPDRHGPQQPQPELRAKPRVAALDRPLRVAQEVRQAHLPSPGVPALAAQRVRHPHAGPHAREHLLRHRLAPAGADQVQHAVPGGKDPFPPGPARHPHRGLVTAHHPRRAHRGGDRGRSRFQRGPRPPNRCTRVTIGRTGGSSMRS